MTALPIVTYPDPEAAVKARIEAACTGRMESYKPATAGGKFPGPGLTAIYAQVALEGPSPEDNYPAKERHQVRVTLWGPADRRADVKDAASLVLGLLCSTPSDETIASISRQLGRSAVIADPDTKYLMCWFLVRVSLHGTQLAS